MKAGSADRRKGAYVTAETKRKLPWILLRCVAFLLCFTVLFFTVSDVLARKSLNLPWNMSLKIEGFYNEPESSIDTMFFGSSHMYCSVDPVLLEERTGRTSYVLATQNQPVWLSYYYMKEAFKTQNPDTVIFEVNMTAAEQDYSDEGANFSAMDPIPFSVNRVAMAMAAAPWGEQRNVLFNIFKYHGRWEELDREDLMRTYKKERDPQRGAVKLDATSPQAVAMEWMQVTKSDELLPKVEDYLNRMIQLSREKGFQLIFLKTPSNPTSEEQECYNAAFQLAEREGIPWLDCNQYYEEIGIDPEKDFYDGHHLNAGGRSKLTEYLANQRSERHGQTEAV